MNSRLTPDEGLALCRKMLKQLDTFDRRDREKEQAKKDTKSLNPLVHQLNEESLICSGLSRLQSLSSAHRY